MESDNYLIRVNIERRKKDGKSKNKRKKEKWEGEAGREKRERNFEKS